MVSISFAWLFRGYRAFPARECCDAGARDLGQAEITHQFDEGVQLVGRTGQFEYEAFHRGVDHAGAKRVGDAQRLDAYLAGADNLYQRHLAGDVRALARQVGHAMHRYEAIELRLDLLDDHFRAGRHDVDPRAGPAAFHRRHCEAVDVIAAAGEQADDAGQDARLVFDQDRYRCTAQCGVGHEFGSASGLDPAISGGTLPRRMAGNSPAKTFDVARYQTSTRPSSVIPAASPSCSVPRIISLWAAPDGIIGKQFSFGSTAMSAITARSQASISRITSSNCSTFSARRPTAWKLSASLTKSGSAAE